jgi:hypothetical protein
MELTLQDKEEWLFYLLQEKGPAWVLANMPRLEEEWAYLMSL